MGIWEEFEGGLGYGLGKEGVMRVSGEEGERVEVGVGKNMDGMYEEWNVGGVVWGKMGG